MTKPRIFKVGIGWRFSWGSGAYDLPSFRAALDMLSVYLPPQGVSY